MPYKSQDLEQRVAKIDGVRQVKNDITTLPVSFFDDELRFRIARAIYGNSNFWRYGSMVNPPIHIIVDGGRVTLEGRREQQHRPDVGAVDRELVQRLLGDQQSEDRRRSRAGARTAVTDRRRDAAPPRLVTPPSRKSFADGGPATSLPLPASSDPPHGE